jgi:hypothetical protein
MPVGGNASKTQQQSFAALCFGNPAIPQFCWGSVALRPRLATGLPFSKH